MIETDLNPNRFQKDFPEYGADAIDETVERIFLSCDRCVVTAQLMCSVCARIDRKPVCWNLAFDDEASPPVFHRLDRTQVIALDRDFL